MRRAFSLCFLMLCCLLASACSAAEPNGPAGAIQPGKIVDGRPVGMFFMTRYWSFTQTLEKAAWYFTADGKVYQNLTDGASPADLAAHKGPQGTFRREGNEMEVTWADGQSAKSEIEIQDNGFMWEMGIFSPVHPFKEAAEAAGNFEGSERISVGGDTAAVSKKLQLNADGTFRWEGIGFVEATGSEAILTAAAEEGTTGSWKLEGFTMTLTAKDGKAIRHICFPFDDTDTPIKPDRIFFGGMLYKKQSE